MKYKVRFYQDDTYEVLQLNLNEDEYEPTGFSGSLADCEAWIRLHESGYMD
jgi:hypothetical protein